MFKLPICPHCGTIYRYKDTKKAIENKENECYHCHKSFRTKVFPYVLIEAIIFVAVSIGINVLILSRLSTLNLIPLFVVTIGFLAIILILVPFFTHFVKTDESKNHNEKKKKHKK